MAHAPYFSQYCTHCGAYLLAPEREGDVLTCACGVRWLVVFAYSLGEQRSLWTLFDLPPEEKPVC